MIKQVLSLIDYRELISNKRLYVFECNMNHYMVYRNNQYKVFNLQSFKHVPPEALFTNFFINEQSFRFEIENRESDNLAISRLEDTKFPKALGEMLELKYLTNSTHVEKTNQNDIDYFNSIEFLKDRVFITKFGLSIFTYRFEKLDGEEPTGMISFNRFNLNYHGSPKLFLSRINIENLNVRKEEVIVMFSPYTIRDCFNAGKSIYKDNLYIIADCTNLQPSDFFDQFKIHLRPTRVELTSYLHYVSGYLTDKGFPISMSVDDYEMISIITDTGNFAVTRNKWPKELSAQKTNLTGLESNENEFRVSLVKKNIRPNVDQVKFSFKQSPDNMIIFIQYFLFSYFNISGKMNLKALTIIHYEKEFPEIIEETMIPESIDGVDKYAPKSNQYDYEDPNS